MQGMYTSLGLKNRMVILHATTTTKVRNRPHQKTITYPHSTPRRHRKKIEIFCGGEGVIDLPLPHSDRKEIPVEELLLFDWSIEYHSTEKINKYD